MSMEAAPFEIAASDRGIHVFRIALDQPIDVMDGLRDILAKDEIARADRFLAARHRTRFMVGRAVMRILLGRYLGEAPERLGFSTNSHGKPELRGAGLEFNLSHSADLAVLAVSRDRRVGIDVEKVRPMAERDRLSARFFSGRECDALNEIPDDQRTEAFFRIWTRKEAYIKAIGDGLAIPLDSFDVPTHLESDSDPVAVESRAGERGVWSVRDVLPGDGFVAALVSEGKEWTLRMFASGFDP